MHNVYVHDLWAFVQHFRLHYVFAAAVLVPVGRVFMRAGFKPYWALLLAVPQIGLLLCGAVLALRKWPQQQSQQQEVAP